MYVPQVRSDVCLALLLTWSQATPHSLTTTVETSERREDRCEVAIFGGRNTLHTGPMAESGQEVGQGRLRRARHPDQKGSLHRISASSRRIWRVWPEWPAVRGHFCWKSMTIDACLVVCVPSNPRLTALNREIQTEWKHPKRSPCRTFAKTYSESQGSRFCRARLPISAGGGFEGLGFRALEYSPKNPCEQAPMKPVAHDVG